MVGYYPCTSLSNLWRIQLSEHMPCKTQLGGMILDHYDHIKTKILSLITRSLINPTQVSLASGESMNHRRIRTCSPELPLISVTYKSICLIWASNQFQQKKNTIYNSHRKHYRNISVCIIKLILIMFFHQICHFLFNKKKLRSFKSSEPINETRDGPYHGFGYLSLFNDHIDFVTWDQRELQ